MMNTKPSILLMLIILLYTLAACKKSESSVTPDMSLPDTISIAERTLTPHPLVIPVKLSVASDKTVSVKLSTSDGSATAGQDYVAISDTLLVFNPGEIEKDIEIQIINDSIYENDETFFVTLNNVQNANTTIYRSMVTIKNDDPFNPEVRLVALSKTVEGTATPVNAKVTVTITPASDKTVTVKWSTKDGTAKSNIDYVAKSGESLVFAPGETQKNIEVPIINDAIFEFNSSFYINVDEVTNAKYYPKEATVTIVDDDTYTPEHASDGYITPDTYPAMQLVWSDEFDGTALNTDWWTYELGAGGWGNNELQNYTGSSANSFVSDGKLSIVAQKNYGNYTSARLVTKGKKEFKYGRIDIRAKLPYGQGIWPALWMLGANIDQVSWPRCGEIDIMEYLGHEVSRVYGTAHYEEGGHQYKGGSYSLSNGQGFNDEYHVFTIMWQENSIVWYVDYHKYFEATSSSINFDAFNLNQFFIFNIAVGGNWPGYPDATTVFPQTMMVDYVRVFQP
jgi:beta-glucanase (GH16 family)